MEKARFRQTGQADELFDHPAYNEQFAFKVFSFSNVRAASNKDLVYHRLLPPGQFTECFMVYRDPSPAEQLLAFLSDDGFKTIHTDPTLVFVRW